MEKFICIFDNVFEDNICHEIIHKYNLDKNKYKGITGSGKICEKVKLTTDLYISNSNEWKNIDNILKEKINIKLNKYLNDLYNFHNVSPYFLSYNLKDSGYMIQKYNKQEGFYNWHDDFSLKKNYGIRVITMILYLNNVEEGGETEFINSIKIKPKKGSLLFFPACWSYTHKGNIPISDDKYICTGWLYCNNRL